ncbi:MAG: hypothetical protein HDR50_06660 [Desulfovibrio sp.]|uniref:hypothetical protein n=1 Tax=Desulfovibrio sp. TaxID=885 RepID=UPI001A7677EC|nr:hypothetical protein [Desulfovibrio sp.]MBD5417329.1 hypothetical protein [Desulfovibrio sp.]
MSEVEIMESGSAANISAPAMPAQVDPVAVAAAEEAKALVQAAYTVALHRPRNYMQARQRILDACKRPSFATTVEYSKPVGGGSVNGPSIRFAELAIQQWGNIRVDTTTTFENDEIRKIRVQVLDLETNACFGRVITINKTVERSNDRGREILRERINTSGRTVYIVRATEDELATKEAAAISKVVRNEGLRLIPQDIIDEALETARKARQGNVSDPQERIRKVCDAFAQIRITPEDLSQYLGCPIDKASPGQIDNLQTVYTAIKSGEAKWSDYVQQDEGKNASAATTETASLLKANLNQAQQKNGNGKESA